MHNLKSSDSRPSFVPFFNILEFFGANYKEVNTLIMGPELFPIDCKNCFILIPLSQEEATNPWGVHVDRVEIKDVRLPQQLQRAMAAEAEATREARAKVIILTLTIVIITRRMPSPRSTKVSG